MRKVFLNTLEVEIFANRNEIYSEIFALRITKIFTDDQIITFQ